jgi:hypothetical protein
MLEGRWTIFVCTGCGGATGRHNACDALREATPVVPVDDAAVERAARRLYDTDDERVRVDGVEWENEPDGYRMLWRDKARDVFRAAGEQS